MHIMCQIPGLGKSAGEGIGYPLQCSWASLMAQLVKESAHNAGDLGSIPGLGRSPGEGKGYLLQHSGLENSMDCIAHGVTKSRTWLSDFNFTMCQKMFCVLRIYQWPKKKKEDLYPKLAYLLQEAFFILLCWVFVRACGLFIAVHRLL